MPARNAIVLRTEQAAEAGVTPRAGSRPETSSPPASELRPSYATFAPKLARGQPEAVVFELLEIRNNG